MDVRWCQCGCYPVGYSPARGAASLTERARALIPPGTVRPGDALCRAAARRTLRSAARHGSFRRRSKDDPCPGPPRLLPVLACRCRASTRPSAVCPTLASGRMGIAGACALTRGRAQDDLAQLGVLSHRMVIGPGDLSFSGLADAQLRVEGARVRGCRRLRQDAGGWRCCGHRCRQIYRFGSMPPVAVVRCNRMSPVGVR